MHVVTVILIRYIEIKIKFYSNKLNKYTIRSIHFLKFENQMKVLKENQYYNLV